MANVSQFEKPVEKEIWPGGGQPAVSGLKLKFGAGGVMVVQVDVFPAKFKPKKVV
jgi:hypothetical protein